MTLLCHSLASADAHYCGLWNILVYFIMPRLSPAWRHESPMTTGKELDVVKTETAERM